jgi:sugar lactone lactonase YvrE
VFAQFESETDRPDGGAVDSDGCYWSAFYRGGRVVRFSPQGRLLEEHPLPAMCPTMCAFGGPDLRTLYVTTARQHRDADELARLPRSGGIFAMRVATPGLAEPHYTG